MKMFKSTEGKIVTFQYRGNDDEPYDKSNFDFACSDVWADGCKCTHEWAIVSDVDIAQWIDEELYSESRRMSYISGTPQQDWQTPNSISYSMNVLGANIFLAQDYELGDIVLVSDLLEDFALKEWSAEALLLKVAADA